MRSQSHDRTISVKHVPPESVHSWRPLPFDAMKGAVGHCLTHGALYSMLGVQKNILHRRIAPCMNVVHWLKNQKGYLPLVHIKVSSTLTMS
jgi:hypothetical protein